MYIPIILGTAREGRQSEKVAKFVLEQVKKIGSETELIDVRDYHIRATNNTGEIPEAKRLAEKVVRAEGFIVVMPEYNHTYPGELKMMLDMIYEQYARKPVGICAVSGGPLGGARGMQALRLTCIGLGLHPLQEAVYFPMVQDLFDEAGKIKDPSYEKKVKGLIDSLIWHAKALKGGE
jgi:NAD(P)H-dependent FMN reductase